MIIGTKYTSNVQEAFGLIDARDVAEALGVTERSLRDWWHKKKGFPKPLLSGTYTLYRVTDILEWVKNQST